MVLQIKRPKTTMNKHPYEVVPSPDDLLPYTDHGLDEIRFRKDGRLAVGLFLRKKDHKTVVGISAVDSHTPFIFIVERDQANAGFEDPYSLAPSIGKHILEDILSKPSDTQAEAA